MAYYSFKKELLFGYQKYQEREIYIGKMKKIKKNYFFGLFKMGMVNYGLVTEFLIKEGNSIMELIKVLQTRVNTKGVLQSWGLFLCSYCLQEVERRLSHGKRQKSCGCAKNRFISQSKRTHGETNTRLYHIWALIKNRCLTESSKDYKNYGGRGITICNEWLDFIPFRDWSLKNDYGNVLQIDRKDNDKGYYPENCRWVTNKENSRNRRTTKLSLEKIIEIRAKYNSGYYTQKQLAKEYNVSFGHISDIVNNERWG